MREEDEDAIDVADDDCPVFEEDPRVPSRPFTMSAEAERQFIEFMDWADRNERP